MITIVDHMLVVNLDAVATFVRSNVVPFGGLVLLVALYLLGGKQK